MCIQQSAILLITKIIVDVVTVESTVFRKLFKTIQLKENILRKKPLKDIHQIQNLKWFEYLIIFSNDAIFLLNCFSWFTWYYKKPFYAPGIIIFREQCPTNLKIITPSIYFYTAFNCIKQSKNTFYDSPVNNFIKQESCY